MRKYTRYIISFLLIIFMVILGVNQVNSQLETNNQNKKIIVDEKVKACNNIEEPEQINPDIQKVQEITGWSEEIATYFVEQANGRGVKIFHEALPIANIESGGTYRFDAAHINSNGTVDGGLFQINDITYLGIKKQLKLEGWQFDSWDRSDPYFNITAGMYWISYLKNAHQLEYHALFSSYNRGVHGAKQYASRCGTYETRYSREVIRIKNELIKQ